MNSPCNNVEIATALIGVGGTIAGTILGWILNSISQKGKLKFFISSWKNRFEYNDTGSMVPSLSKEQTELYCFELTLDIYNSSRNTKIMRNIKVVFSDKKKELKSFTPKDNSTRHHSGAINLYDDVSPLNIPPQTVMQIKLYDGVWKKNKELDFIWDVKKVYLKYENDRGKTKRILLHKEPFCDYFQNHIAEEKEDGQA